MATVIKNPSHRYDGVDSISSLPDDILHHIFTYIPTKFAIRTSLLSKRWRHVWSETPFLSFDRARVSPKSINENLTRFSVLSLNRTRVSPKSINKTLKRYSATKITSFHLSNSLPNWTYNDRNWIEYAMSHHVEKLSLEGSFHCFPDSFLCNSSLKHLIFVNSDLRYMIHNVSWKSLRFLSLSFCKLSYISISGCPMLESLTLRQCKSLQYLDLSKALHLKRLDIDSSQIQAPMRIFAPHIHYLRLINDLRLRSNSEEAQYTLVESSSLTEAVVDINKFSPRTWCYRALDVGFLQVVVQAMLVNLQNAEKLTVGVKFLLVLSLSEFHGVSFPMLKVKSLTLKSTIVRSVVPGIAKLLQISPGLKKITFHTMKSCTVENKCVESYLDYKVLNTECKRWKDVAFPTSWERKVPDPKQVVLFMEILIANARKLETLSVKLGNYFDRSGFGELFRIAQSLSHTNEVSIVLM